jgi:hypothetical protein
VPEGFLASLASPPLLRLPPGKPWLKVRWLAGKVATYARTGSAVAFNISELPGERAEALFIAMAALVPTAGEQINHIRLWSPSSQEGTP